MKFHGSGARFKGFSGPIGSGKSQALCQEAIKLSYLNPGRTGLIGAPTYPMLRDATLAALIEVLDNNKIPHTVNRGENYLVMKDTGSRILFRPVEEFERLRGSNLAWFGVDELTYTQEEAWLRLEGRLRDPQASKLCGFAVWTPKGYDWVYERFVASPVEGYETVFAKPFENRFLLDEIPDYYDRLRHSYDGRFYQQEVLGEYLECAEIMDDAGIQPYLQFGEVQWWYFPNNGLGTTPPNSYSGMPFYDAWTQAEFTAQYSRAMEVFTDNDEDPTSYPEETSFLQGVLGDFTDDIMAYVTATYSTARFEVLYPYDVNQTDFNKVINFPVSSWTPTALDNLKTEGLSMTFTRRLDLAEEGIEMGEPLGFNADQRSHLIGVGDATAPWLKETHIATGQRFESVVYFALDQYCLIGLPLPVPALRARSYRIKR